mmetsp:Transcript_46514/g.90864  ORF Transcript_46514/g.90864 Transcript_46514/m.90864 type:complete len:92 (-) Transcript_46514:292-567(-)
MMSTWAPPVASDDDLSRAECNLPYVLGAVAEAADQRREHDRNQGQECLASIRSAMHHAFMHGAPESTISERHNRWVKRTKRILDVCKRNAG